MNLPPFIYQVSYKMKNAERAFVISKQLNRLLSVDSHEENQLLGGQSAGILSMQAVVDAVIHPARATSQNSLSLVNTSLVYFSWYKHALSCLTHMRSYQQVAASSASEATAHKKSFTRHGQGFTLSLIESRIDANRHIGSAGKTNAFVEVTLHTNAQQPDTNHLFLHCEYDQQIHVLSLLRVGENNYQGILQVDDIIAMVIINNESQLYLR